MSLVLRDIRFDHGRRHPLFDGASLRVQRGAVVGLTGPSGSGKSTLAALAAGDLHPRSGEVRVDGAPLPRRGFRPVQLIHQHPEQAVNPWWRISDILSEPRRLDPGTLERFGIRPAWLSRRPGELSGGELQRCCIARAFDPRTRYLIADEMTAMFDAVTQAEIWHVVLREVRQRGLGLLVISHEAALLDRICDEQIDVSALADTAQ